MPGTKASGGRNKKSLATHLLQGTFRKDRHGDLVPPETPPEIFDPPKTLRGKPRAVWDELAPFAFEARTLTPASASMFAMVCRGVVKERALSASKKHAGGSNHRGLMQRVSSWLKDFGLAPIGKPMSVAQPETAANPLDRYTKKVGA